MTISFDGQTVIVTGAGRGLGRSYAHLFAQYGAHVVVHDAGVNADGESRDRSIADGVVEKIREAGSSASARYENLLTRDGCRALISSVIQERGRIDTLVSNAGIVRWASLADTDEALWDQMRRVNLDAALWLSQAAMPVMERQRYGRIVLTMTGHSLVVDPDTTELIAYSTAKAGIIGLMHSLAGIGKPHGILVNAVAPVAATRIFRRETTPDELAPERVAPSVMFLGSSNCDVTGAMLDAADGNFDVRHISRSPGMSFGAESVTPEMIAERWHEVSE